MTRTNEMKQTNINLKHHGFSRRSLFEFPELWLNLLRVKCAAATTNQQCGLINKPSEQAILAACDRDGNIPWKDLLIADPYQGGGGIAINMNINEAIVVQHLARNNPNVQLDSEIVNMSQSTADACATAIRIGLFQICNNAIESLNKLSEAFKNKSMEFRGINTIARTCLRDAMPVELAEKFMGYSLVLERRKKDLERLIPILLQVSLGGTVIGGSDNAPPEYVKKVVPNLAKLLNIDLVQRKNLYDAAQNIDDLGAVSITLDLLADNLIKIAKDLRLLNSGPNAGFSEIQISPIAKGSSFFQGKVNPTMEETLIQMSFLIKSSKSTVGSCLSHGELDLNIFEMLAGMTLIDATRYLTIFIPKFTEHSVKNIQANADRCESYVQTM